MSTHSLPPEQPPPVDDPFLERLFGVMCQHIPVRRDESFVGQARRWCDTLQFMAALQPRTSAECLLAADVAMKDQFVQETLARGKGPAGRRRRQQSREFILRTQDLHDAQMEYSLLRARPVE